MNGTAAVGGRQVWVGAVLVALATTVGTWTMTGLLAPGPWRAVSAIVVVLVASVVAVARAVGRARLAPSGWGLAAGVVALVSLYGGTGTTPGLPLPTPDTLDRLVRLGRSGVDAIVEGRIPVEPSRGLELLVVAGAVAVVLATDLLALGLGRAGLAGLPLLGVWLPTILFERDPGVVLMVLGGVTYLMLLSLTRPRARRSAGESRDALPALAAAVVVCVLALASGPVASALPFYGSVRVPGSWGPAGIDGPLRLSTDLDMRSSLGQRSDRPVLTYSTDATAVGPLRMYTMVDFDGREWHRGDTASAPEDLSATDGVLWPQEAATPAPDEVSRLSVRVGELAQDRLPIPTEPRAVDVAGSWLYDPVRDEVIGARSTSTRGLSYEVTIAARDLSPDVLRQDERAPVASDDPTLALPDSAFAADIRALAAELTADATTTYDQALALQSYFRDIRNFRYDTQLPPAETEDAVWDFLTQKSGYCVQFATGMTVMARTLGIPARLAVGFLPGAPSTEVRGEFVVSGRQAHAWPELYFADAGWVRFEPTPAVQTGAPPVYADPFAGLPVTPGEQAQTQSAAPSLSPGAVAPQQPQQGGGGQVGIGSASVPTWLVLAGSGLLLVVAAATVLALRARRRRRHPRLPADPEGWWGHLRALLTEAGVTWSDAMTPRQVGELLRERVESGDRDPLERAEALEALARLVATVESTRYAPDPGAWDVGELQGWVEAVHRVFAPAPAREPVGAR